MSYLPGLVSPDKRNLIIGKGFGLIKRDDDTEFRHVGNAPSVVFTPTAETIEHFTSMEGLKQKDETLTLSQGGTLKLTLEERTALNLGMMVMGDVDKTDLENIVINIFARESIVAAFKFYGTNSKGPRWYWSFNQITFTPSGDVEMVSDSYGNTILTGSVETNGGFGTITLKRPVGEVAPENVLLPNIEGNNPSEVGDELFAALGGWVDVTLGYTYKWKRGGVDIVGATSSSYTVVGDDDGEDITVEITGTNAIGSTAALSAAITIGTTF